MPIDTTAGAFIAGMVTSLHCTVMCGPIACAWAIGSKNLARDTAIYHGARLSAYTLIGALAGALGTMPLRWFNQGGGAVLPWLLVLVFFSVAIGLDRWMPKPRVLSKPVARIRIWCQKIPGAAKAAVLGAATPLLPCGPLYLMFALAMANGSASRGAQFAAAFGFGTLPLLWLAQTQMTLLNLRFGPNTTRWVQRSFALCAAVIMAWRLRGSIIGDPLASCCH